MAEANRLLDIGSWFVFPNYWIFICLLSPCPWYFIVALSCGSNVPFLVPGSWLLAPGSWLLAPGFCVPAPWAPFLARPLTELPGSGAGAGQPVCWGRVGKEAFQAHMVQLKLI